MAGPVLTPEQEKALRHIRTHGDDRALRARRWHPVKLELHRMGLLRRRVPGWAWVAVQPPVPGER